jgi:hypothetical protein
LLPKIRVIFAQHFPDGTADGFVAAAGCPFKTRWTIPEESGGSQTCSVTYCVIGM